MVSARRDLPEPSGPSISTVARVGAAWRACSSTRRMARERASSRSKPWRRSSRASSSPICASLRCCARPRWITASARSNRTGRTCTSAAPSITASSASALSGPSAMASAQIDGCSSSARRSTVEPIDARRAQREHHRLQRRALERVQRALVIAHPHHLEIVASQRCDQRLRGVGIAFDQQQRGGIGRHGIARRRGAVAAPGRGRA